MVGPEIFDLAPGVVGNDRVGGIQDVLGGPVILLQTDHQGVGIVLLEVQDVADVGSPELIDGLVVVAHHAKVPEAVRQEPDQFELGRIGVLVFVHHDVDKALLIVFQHLRVLFEELHRQHEKIVEVQGVVLFQGPLVRIVAVCDLSVPVVVGSCLFLPEADGSDQLVLGRRND